MRPFSQTIGHQRALDVLMRLFAGDRAPHALLIVGPSHVGKGHVIGELVRYLLQTDRPFEALSDVVVVKRQKDRKTEKQKNNISVEQIRELTARLSMSSLGGSWKVAIIEEAQCLSIGAANALLKTLEEPKGQTLIILRAPSVESVLPTIASRCQYVRLSIVPQKELVGALQKRGLSGADAETLAARSLGCPGLAIRYIQDGGLRARKELAREQVRTLLVAPLHVRLRAVTELIPKTEEDKARLLSRLLDDWSEVLRERMLEDARSREALRRVGQVREAIRHNINPHLALEHILL